MTSRGRLLLLPVGSGVELPRGASAQVSCAARREVEVVDLATREGRDWRVHGAAVHSVEDWGAPLAPLGGVRLDELSHVLATGGRPFGDRIARGRVLSLRVEYAGPRRGGAFCAALVGRDSSRVVDDAKYRGRVREAPLDGGRVTASATGAWATCDLGARALVEEVRLEGAESWLVQDLQVDGESLLAHARDLPGVALTVAARRRVRLGTARTVRVFARRAGGEPGAVLRGQVLVREPGPAT